MLIQKQLAQIVQLRPLIIGIGNELRGDDAAGILLVQNIQKLGYPYTLVVGGNPENYLQKIIAMPAESRLWIDTINWGATAGQIKIFQPEEITHFAISTHNFSLALITKFLNESRAIPDFFLGIQPQSLDLGSELSKPVLKSVHRLTKILSQYIEKNF